jgi:hypothetical protein
LNCSSKLSIGVSTLYVWFPAISPVTHKSWLSHFKKSHTHCIQPLTTPAANMARHVCTAKSEHAHSSRPRLLAVFDPCRAERVVIGRQGGKYVHTQVYYADICVHTVLEYFYLPHIFLFVVTFCVVMLCHWSGSSRLFDESFCLHLQSSAVR